MLFIKIANDFESETIFHNGEYLTTKTNKSAHGYGIKSARRIVEKYDGSITFQAEENVFQVKISFLSSEGEKEEMREENSGEACKEERVKAPVVIADTKLRKYMPFLAIVDFIWNVLTLLDIFHLSDYMIGIEGLIISCVIIIYSSICEILYLIRKSKRDQNNRIGMAIALSIFIKVSASVMFLLLKIF